METNVSKYIDTLDISKNEIIFCDVTMREGEQSPGVVFSLDEKKALLRRLSDIGVNQIQFYPGKTKESRAVVQELVKIPVNADIELTALGFEECWKDNLKFSIDNGTNIVHSSFYTTPYVMSCWCEDTPKIIKDRIAEVVSYAKSQVSAPIEIAMIDSTRADRNTLLDFVETAFSAGADRVRLADTIGVATPDAMEKLVTDCVKISQRYDGIIGVHCHNDFGFALANTIASIKAGARLIDIAVNGLGDRAGNTCLAELAVALEALYGVETGIDLSSIAELSYYVEKVSGSAIPNNAPLVGRHVFVDCDDFHIAAQKISPLSFRGIIPEDIGMKYDILFGKLTGPNAIEYMCQKRNRRINPEFYGLIHDELYAMAVNAPKGRVLCEDDFWQIVNRIESKD